MTCKKCGAPLQSDDIGLNKKMISREAESFLCLDCLALHFGCAKELLERKITEFKASGCTLFIQSTPIAR